MSILGPITSVVLPIVESAGLAPTKLSDREVWFDAPSPDGFGFGWTSYRDEIVVHWEGDHNHFMDRSAAIGCILWALTHRARVGIKLRGSNPVGWQSQVHDGNEWRSVSTTSLLFSPFWLPRGFMYLQNRVLDPSAHCAAFPDWIRHIH
ncbi:MAG TPA: hypothetical protein VG797_06950 [Phycisphaerales bacterium]|nr:hypothetical protein [Phycisphaerales bacterium]